MRRLDLWTRYYIRWNPTMQPQVCDTLPVVHACESVEKFDLESSCWFLFGFAGIRGTEKPRIALSLRTGTQRMSQYWKKFHSFFCNWQMYISPALFINSLDIFSFFL